MRLIKISPLQSILRTSLLARAFRVALCVVAALFGASAFAAEGRILVIGAIEADQKKVSESLKPMADYVQSKMADIGIENVVVVAAQDREHLAQLIRHGRVDWISQTAYNASYFIQNADVSVLSRGWRGGSPTYKSVFFVHKDSKLTHFDQLDNHSIAFEHPYSTSAYFVPRIELESNGKVLSQSSVDLNEKLPGGMAYSFSQSEYNTAVWVQKGIVDVGVVSDSRWLDNAIVPNSFRKTLRVIHETKEVVRALELVRGNLDADIKMRLGDVLHSLHTDAGAEQARTAYFDTHRFDKPTEDDIVRLNDFAVRANAISLQPRSSAFSSLVDQEK